MAYSDFKKLSKVVEAFDLRTKRSSLFDDVKPMPPSDFLKTALQKSRNIGFTTEKERSERLVSPILLEVIEINNFDITIYSGHNLDVDSDAGLAGECDFLMSLGKKALEVIEAPVFSIVEAKREDMDYGIAQCIAQLIGVQRFNKKKNIEFPYLYGCSTDGLQWRFFKLEGNTVHLDTKTYLLSEVENLLGIFNYAYNDCKKFL